MSMMTLAVLGLAAASSVGIRQGTRARDDSQYWADAQRVIDSVIGAGYKTANFGTTGSRAVNGRSISWTFAGGSAAPQKVTFVVSRFGYQTKTGGATTTGLASRYTAVNDTVIIYLSKSTPGS